MKKIYCLLALFSCLFIGYQQSKSIQDKEMCINAAETAKLHNEYIDRNFDSNFVLVETQSTRNQVGEITDLNINLTDLILFLASQKAFKNKITNEEINQTIDIYKNISLQNNIPTLSDDFLHSMITLAENTHNEKLENIISRN